MSKKIFLVNANPFFIDYYNKHGVDVVPPYKYYNFVTRRMINTGNKIIPGLFDFVLNNSVFLQDASLVVFDGSCTEEIIKWVSSHKRNGLKLYYWYWNPARMSNFKRYLSDFKVATYSLFDSKKYNIPLNNTYYFSEIKLPRENLTTDIYFLGGDKGRYQLLTSLNREFKNRGLSTEFIVVQSNGLYRQKKYDKPLSYKENLVHIARSKAILEILSNPDDGLSLRAMEALFFKKKLITNSKEIKFHPFYNPSNIFILGEDNLQGLSRFLESNYIGVDSDIIAYYDFDQWIKRWLT